MDALPAAMDTLSLADTVPSNRIDKIRRAIAELGVARGQTKLRQRLRVHAWHEGKSSHELFRSISTKFTDNAVPTLIPSEVHPHGMFMTRRTCSQMLGLQYSVSQWHSYGRRAQMDGRAWCAGRPDACSDC